LPTALLTGLVAWGTERFHVEWAGEFVFALGWLVFVLSLGAISLLNLADPAKRCGQRRSLFYLVPPCTALVAWGLFGETLSGTALVGMALTVWGVYLGAEISLFSKRLHPSNRV